LRGYDNRLALAAFLQNLEQGQTRVVVERLQTEVIEDDEVVALDVV
jgi:hypothetical protein